MPKKMKKSKRHNKKRNTAFLFEVLTREATKCVLEGNESGKQQALSLCVEFFNKKTELYKELELYKAVLATNNLDEKIAEKFLNEAKKQFTMINQEKVFKEQNTLISRINREMSGRPFSYFVPDYKNLATISQVFNGVGTVRERVLLEQRVVENLCSNKRALEEQKMETLDNLTFKTFIKKFNDKYQSLLSEQRELMTKYILSFNDNGLGLKVYLNEELGRLVKKLEELQGLEEVKEDKEMLSKSKQIIAMIESFKREDINENMINSVLKIQSLISESEEGSK